MYIQKKIHLCTYGFNGPIILSDKQYKDGVVFYRYGAFKGIKSDDSTKLYICDENNNWVKDKRNAWFSLPTWISDPFDDNNSRTIGQEISSPKQKLNLLYSIRHANKGGVYVAEKEDGTKVILKEARKYVSTDNLGYDVSDYLKNEYNILMLLNNKKYVPKVLDFLETPHSSFLIEELVDGQILSQYINSVHTSFDPQNDIHNLLFTTKSIIEAIIDIHNNGIIVRDLSKNNIIVTTNNIIKVIDFDISYNIKDRLYAHNGGTEGYFYKERNHEIAIIADDIYIA